MSHDIFLNPNTGQQYFCFSSLLFPWLEVFPWWAANPTHNSSFLILRLSTGNGGVTVNGEDLTTRRSLHTLSDTTAERSASDIKNRLSKARNAFRMLQAVWKSSQYSTKTKLRLYQSCVLSTLLYGSECWTRRGWQKVSSTSSPPSTQRISEESYAFSGPKPSPTKIYSPAATNKAWRASSCEGDGDGLDMSCVESRTTSPAQPYIGHQRENARKDGPRTPGAEHWGRS